MRNIFFILIQLELKRILSPSNFLKGVHSADTIELFADAYHATYQTLYEAKPMTCSVTGTTFDAVPSHPRRKPIDIL